MTSKSAKYIVFLTFIVLFIFPNGLLFGTFNAIHVHLYCAIVGVIYLLPKLRKNKISYNALLFWIFVFIVSFYTKRFGFIDMIILPIFRDFIENKSKIKAYIMKSKIPYISIIFLLMYSLLYRLIGIGGRNESSSIGSGVIIGSLGEVNVTGLSLFCLSMILRKKNKPIGNFSLVLGLLTFSRSYILAVLCVFIFNFIAQKNIFKRILKKISYLNLTIISSILLFLLGIFYINLYRIGMISPFDVNEGVSRIFRLFDYSNLYRFLAIYLIVIIIINNPSYIMLGFSDEVYVEQSAKIKGALGLELARDTGTHNLFFAHLKMYGLAALFEIYFVSKYLKRIISNNNFGIFIGLFFYCIILGSGFSGYWLYLSGITLIMNE